MDICHECGYECDLIENADPETGEPLTSCCRSNQYHLEEDEYEREVEPPDDDWPDDGWQKAQDSYEHFLFHDPGERC